MTLLLSDIDHTLFNENFEISTQNLNTIRTWKSFPENVFYLCSGRNLNSISNIKNKIPFKLCCNCP